MIGIFATSILIVGVGALLAIPCELRTRRAQAEVRVLELRDRRRQEWIEEAVGLVRRGQWPCDHDEVAAGVLEHRARVLRELAPLELGGAEHHGAVRIAQERIAMGMEVTP